MDITFQVLLFLHVIAGIGALTFGTLVLIIRKGGRRHKKWGKLFHYSMLTVGISAILITVFPEHANPFLFGIGILSIYFTQTGQMTVRWRTDVKISKIYWILSSSLLLVGLFMMARFIFYRDEMLLYLIFGTLAGVFAVSDLRIFMKPIIRKGRWIQIHISKMMGAYISAISAFLVVNQVFHPMINWLAPGIIGGSIIANYTRKSKVHPRQFLKKTTT